MTAKETYLNTLLERIKEFPPEIPEWINKEYSFNIDNLHIYIALHDAWKQSKILISNIYQASISKIKTDYSNISDNIIATHATDPDFFEELVSYLQSLEQNSMEAFFEKQAKLLRAPNREFDPVYEDIKKINYHKEEIINITKKYHKNFFQKLFNI
jgi:hypothetical protein